MSMRTQIFAKNYGYGKLFAKTNSTSNDWKVNQLGGISPTLCTIIDNVLEEIVKQYTIDNTGYSLNADLSLGSGDYSIYLKVDDTGNGCNSFSAWYGISKLTYINFDAIPLVKAIRMYSYGTTIINGSLLELEYFNSYSNHYIGFNFSQTTKMTFFNVYGSVSFDQEVDLRNNPNLEFYSNPIYSSLFNVNNHRLLETLYFKDLTGVIDANINTDFLPNLRTLNLAGTLYQNYDFNTRRLDKLTSLTIKPQDFLGLNTLISLISLTVSYENTQTNTGDLKLIPNLQKLIIGSGFDITILDLANSPINYLKIQNLRSITTLDLKDLPNLTEYLQYYKFDALTDVFINNGLNAQIIKFYNFYNTKTFDVVVDNPTDANNGDAPYLPTIWKEYLSNDSWNFI